MWGASGGVTSQEGFGQLFIGYNQNATQWDKPGDSTPAVEDYKIKGVVERNVLYYYKINDPSNWLTRWLPVGWRRVQIYQSLREFLKDTGDYRPQVADAGIKSKASDLFFFPYDWRLDNRIAAVKLALILDDLRGSYKKLALEKFCASREENAPCGTDANGEFTDANGEFAKHWEEVKQERPDLFTPEGKIKFIVVGHSMGGLVARYFVTALGGGRDVHKLILMGTPVRGSVGVFGAFLEGRLPDTFMGDVFGLSWYSQDDTRPVIFSMTSLFELLPTYKESVHGKTLDDLGLNLDVSFDSMDWSKIFQSYKDAQVLPGYFRTRKFLPSVTSEEEYRDVMYKYLISRLRSMQCFHRASDLRARKEGKLPSECDERGRVEEAAKFIRGTRPEFETNHDVVARYVDVVARVESALDEERRAARTIILSGHCQPTQTVVEFLPDGRAEVREHRDRPLSNEVRSVPEGQEGVGRDQASGDSGQVLELGDGTVSIFSTGVLEHPGNVSDFNFMVCEDHLHLPSNEVFQYNLLRELTVN